MKLVPDLVQPSALRELNSTKNEFALHDTLRHGLQDPMTSSAGPAHPLQNRIAHVRQVTGDFYID